MADSAAGPSESSLEPCVVLQAWKSSPTVMNRLLQGMLVHLPPDTKKIKRDHLGENVDLLGPMINNVGFLPYTSVDFIMLYWILYTVLCDQGLRPSVNVIAEYFRRFYMGFRPMSLRMPTSNQANKFDHLFRSIS